ATLTPSRAPARRGHQLAGAGLAVALTALNLRTAVTGFTPLLETIGADLGYGVTVAGPLGTVPAVSVGAFGLLAPLVMRRFGLEPPASAPPCLAPPSPVPRALSPSPTALVASTVVALAGIAAAPVVLVPLLKPQFPARIALWTSLYLILMQTGQFAAPLL